MIAPANVDGLSGCRVVLIGAGGLGGPMAFGLAARGAQLEIWDADRVELSNLPRQVQFHEADVGRGKAAALAAALTARGHQAHAIALAWRAGDPAADDACARADLVIDATDAPNTKFAIADARQACGRPYVIAGALGVEGTVFLGGAGGACYRCVFETDDGPGASCASDGVLAPTVGLVAAWAVAEACALWHGRREAGTLWAVADVRRDPWPRAHVFARRRSCPTCGGRA